MVMVDARPLDPVVGSEIAVKSVVVLDPMGEVFQRVRELDLGVALWRVIDLSRMSARIDIPLLIWSAYAPLDWDRLARIGERTSTILITTTYDAREAIDALEHDMIGYLDATMPATTLRRAIAGAIANDEPAFRREAIGSWMHARRGEAASQRDGAHGLTTRQRQIMELVARGSTDKEIAKALGIAQATAQKHVTNILQRLGVPNRAAAVARVAALSGYSRRGASPR